MSDKAGNVEIIARGVFVRGGQVLLCHTAGAVNMYLPGGHVEFQESAPDSLVREVLEEMGLEAKAGRFLGAVEHRFTQKGKPKAEINLVFGLEIPGLDPASPAPSREAHIDFRWVKVEDLAAAGLEPAPLRALIPRWARGDFSQGWASTYLAV